MKQGAMQPRMRALSWRLGALALFLTLTSSVLAQCPNVYDQDGNVVSNPYWISCSGTSFTLSLQPTSPWGAFNIDWGDGSAHTTGNSWTSPTIIQHTYSAVVDTFQLTITQLSNGCVVHGVVVMEQATNASIQVPIGAYTSVCAPATVDFINSSTNVSETTVFTWDFGDGTPPLTFDYTNWQQTVSHLYADAALINCQTTVSLTASNHCNVVNGSPSVATFTPVNIWTVDQAAITVSNTTLCNPSNTFTFNNTSIRNCYNQGNTYPRLEMWNFGDYWGLGHDSIVGWTPFPPSLPHPITFPGVGDYTVMLYDSSYCGIDSAAVTVHVINPPVASISVQPTVACVGQQVTFLQQSTGNGQSYLWNFGTNNTWSNQGNGNVTYTYNTPGTYTVSAVAFFPGLGGSCRDTATVQVTVLPSPTAVVIATPTQSCDSALVVLSSQTTNATSYSWNLGGGFGTFNGQFPDTLLYNIPGTYTVTLTVTSANGCTSSDSQTIHIYDTPNPGFIANTPCVGQPVNFTNTSTGSSGNQIVSRTWNFGDGGTSTQNNPNHTYNTAGTYNVSLTVNTAHCSASITQPITVNPVPVASFSMSQTSGCQPVHVVFNNTSTGATTYNWNFGDGQSSTLQNPVHDFYFNSSSNHTFTVTLTVTNQYGCSSTVTNQVTVLGGPVAAIGVGSTTLGCTSAPIQFSNNSTGASSVLWNFGDGSTSTQNNPVHTFINNSGFIQNYTVTLTAYSTGGCTGITTVQVPVYPLLNLQVSTTPQQGCSPYTFQAPVFTGVQAYTWNFGDGTTSTLPFPSHVYSNTTGAVQNYTVHFVGTSAFGCTDTLDFNVSVSPQAIAGISADPTGGCSPLTVQLNSTSVNASSLLWNFGDGTTSSAATNSHVFNNTTGTIQTFTISLTANSVGNCPSTTAIQIPVFPSIDVNLPVTNVGGCSPFVFQAPTATGAQQFAWNFGDGTSSSLPFPVHVYTNPGNSPLNYTVHFVGSNSFGCSDSANIQVSVLPQAVAQINAAPIGGCSPVAVNFQDASQNASSIHWDFGDGQTSTASTITHTFVNNTSNVITYQVQLIANATGGCGDTTYIQIPVYPSLDVQMPITTASGCSPLTFSAPQISGVQSFIWNFGDGTASTLPYPVHVYSNTTNAVQNFTIHITGTSGFGCVDSATIQVSVLPQAIANIVADPTIGCSPLPVDFVSTSQNATSLNWNFGDGSTSTASVVSHTFSNLSSLIQLNTVTLIANNTYGCADTTGIQIPVYPELNLQVDNAPQNGCSPYTFLVPSISDVQTYFWDFGDGDASNLPYPVHVYTNTTNQIQTHLVHFVGASGFGCMDSVDFVVTVQPQVIADIQANVTSGCGPLEVTFTNNSMNAGSYVWSYGNGSTSNTNLISHNVVFTNGTTVPQHFQVALQANQTNGCSSVDTLSIIVNPDAAAAFNYAGVGCSPLVVNFNNTSSFGSNAEWDFGDGTTSSEGFPSHTFYANGFADANYNVRLVATNTYGCTDTIQHPIQVLYSPVANGAIVGTEGCYPLNVTLANLSQGATSFIWSYGNGITSSTDAAEHTYSYFNISDQTQTYTITLNATAPNGCSAAWNTNVSVLPQITADADVYVSGCNPVHAVFNNQSIGASTYLWEFGNGNTSASFNEDQLFYNNGTTDTTYVVTLTTTNAFNCSVSHDYLILVHPMPQALFTATPELQTWPENEVAIVNTSFGTNLGYHWSFGDGTQAFVSSPETHQFPTWGTYNIELIVNQGTCTDTLVVPVSITPPAAVANFTASAQGCAPVVITMQNSSTFAASYLWIFGDGGTSTASNPTYTYWTPGTYSITLIAYGYDGGSDTITVANAITVYPNATAAFTVTPNEVSIPNQPVYLVNLSSVATTYQWSFGDGEYSTTASPIHYYQSEGNYNIQLIANNQYNCPDTLTYYDVVHAIGDGLLDYPNAFTPNHNGQGDGIYDPIGYTNDIFCPIHKGVTSYELQIFNKWGELLFQTDNVRVGWDGYYRGQLCKEDVYAWKARATFANGTSVTKAGDVTLLAR